MKMILLGAPGAGKGTQAEMLCDTLSIPTVSTGNMLREAVKAGTESGLYAKSFMDAGKLVPDEVVIAVLKDRIASEDCKNGFILDGFPRNVSQAEALDAMGVQIDVVLDIEVADEVIAGRLTGRRVCEGCGSSYHLQHKKPAVEGVCDRCGGKLIQRKDDAPETVADRLSVYHVQTEPLKDYYAGKGILKIVDVPETASVEETGRLVLTTLGVQA